MLNLDAAVKLLGFIWSGKMCIVPGAVSDRIQAFMWPMGVLDDSHSPPGAVSLSLLLLGQERTNVGLAIKATRVL